MLFAINGLDTSQAAQYLLRGLAVGGAFLVGYVLTWLIAKMLDRSLTAGKSPPTVHKTVRVLGGLLLAVIAAIFLFGPGGDGLGFGGGPGDGRGQGTGEGKGGGDATHPTQPISTDVKPAEPSKGEAVPPEQRVRVTMLGGEDVKDERFYLLDDDRTAHTFTEVTAAVSAKKSASAKPVGVEVRFTATNTLPRTHPAVLRLTNWAQANGVSVSFPAQP
jgi:hypothetical protein